MPVAPPAARLAALAALLPLAACATPVAVQPAETPARRAAAPFPSAVPDEAQDALARAAVGRWIAVDVVGDAAATRDLERGTLEKVLVVNPGGHVILRGTDRAQSADPVSFSGTLAGRVLTFADLPGAAILVLDGTRLILVDPSGQQTRFIRDAE